MVKIVPCKTIPQIGLGTKHKYHIKGITKIKKEDRHKSMLILGKVLRGDNDFPIGLPKTITP